MIEIKRKIILASHGEMAEGLKKSLEMIVGAGVYPIETYGLFPGAHADQFADNLRKDIEANPETEFVILVDLFGASVSNSFIPLTVYKNVIVFTGMNLPLLLEIVLSNDSLLVEETSTNIINKSRESIKKLEIDYSKISIDNEF